MRSLTSEYNRFNVPKEKKSYEGLDALLHRITGKIYKRIFSPSRFWKQAEEIYLLSLDLHRLSEKELTKEREKYRAKIRLGKNLRKEEISGALSCIAEISHRTLGIRPYEVQLMGAIAQYHNFAIEMLPGEGKTITAAISAVLAAWKGKPCHVVTSNDYLAGRDAKIMEPLYNGCGLKVGSVHGTMDQQERGNNYLCDVVYATSNEFLADFLRDQMVTDGMNFSRFLVRTLAGTYSHDQSSRQVMQGIYSAIVDEADSVLADEATTPLIISATSKNDILQEAVIIAGNMIREMEKDIHYKASSEYHEIDLTKAGEELIEKITINLPAVWKSVDRREFLIKQALSAREFFHRDTHYIINSEGKVVIVDEKTGRMMPSRSWSAGLHQAVEYKEGVEISDPTETHTRMSFQRFFRFYQNLSGMSGTLQGLEEEFWHIYKLPTIKIPKNIRNTYELRPYLIFATAAQKWEAVTEDAIRVSLTGRPVLVGTRSIEETEILSQYMKKAKTECTVLNALFHEEEAEIIKQAGEKGKITIATNMAGRGTDIILGAEVISLGGLHVIATHRFESRRVDLQLFGRAARQGQPGSVQPILSLQDDLLQKFAPPWLLGFLAWNLSFFWGNALASFVYTRYQSKAEKIASEVRSKILSKDFSLNEVLSFTMK